MDLTKLSTEDLLAIKSGDLSKVSTQGLMVLRGGQGAQQPTEVYDPTEGMSTAEKFLAGTGKAFVDVGRGVRQYLPKSLGGLTAEQIAEAKAIDAPLMRTGAGMAGNVLGNVAIAAPAALIPGAATIPGAALTGGALGALQPGVDAGERVANIGLGAAASAAVPVAMRGAQVARSFADPLYQGGRERIMGNVMRRVAGDQADDAVKNLRAAREIVPGSLPTTAEAAQIPSIAALQRTAVQSDPVAMNQLIARQTSQNQARQAALQAITPDEAAARSARSAASDPLYDATRKAGFDPDAVDAASPQIAGLMKRIPADLLNDAKTLSQVSGDSIDEMGSVRGAHYLKMAIDSRISQAKMSGDATAARAFSGLQNDFLDVLDNVSPLYKQARETFAKLSPPVNQAKVLQAIGQRSVNFRGDLTPAAFSRAATDKTAQSVLRNPSATLRTTLTPQQQKTLQNIQADLLRSEFAQNAGRGVGSDTVQKLAFSNIMQQSGLPSVLQGFAPASMLGNVAQRAGQVIYRDANQEMAQQLAQAMLDPQQAAALMQAARTNPRLAATIQALRMGGVAAGSSVPALANANEQ